MSNLMEASVCHASPRAPPYRAPPYRAPPFRAPPCRAQAVPQQQRLARAGLRGCAALSLPGAQRASGVVARGGRTACSSARVRCQASSSAAAGKHGWAEDDERASPALAAAPMPLAAGPPPQTVPAHVDITAPAASPSDSLAAAAAAAPTPTHAASATAHAAVPPSLASELPTAGEVGQQQAAGEAAGEEAGEVGTASPGEEAAEGVELSLAEKERFDWNKAWYAVGVIADMDASRPHALTVVGRPLVLWRDASHTWRAFADQCPHRLVPLSEGRIDAEGRLACSYHGWAFAGSGACQLIPQAPQDNPGQPPRALSSPRACATAFPTRELHGILFVWPDSASAEQAERTAIPEPEGVEWDACDMMVHARRVSYSYEVLAENFADPAHIFFAHHGFGPLHRHQGAPMKEISLHSLTKDGFQGTFHDALSPAIFTFSAPSFICYNRALPPSPAATAAAAAAGEAPPAPTTAIACLYMTPMRPGECLMISLQGNDEGVEKGNKGAAPRRKTQWNEQFASRRWCAHLFTHALFDSTMPARPACLSCPPCLPLVP
ncbi:unnamed protein product [Closterium sp. Yama58-4]|nr:unnamed protein product [Closterium sp. Yama58-4]